MKFWGVVLISFLSFSSFIQADVEEEEDEVLIIVLNPLSSFNIRRAEDLKKDILNQYEINKQLLRPRVNLYHDKYSNIKGAWTLIPIIQQITEECESCKAVLFMDDSSHLNLHLLTLEFSKLPLSKNYFGGRVLRDASMTIIHHYNIHRDASFPYPHIASGFFLSRPLLLNLHDKIMNETSPILFSLDAYYEFAVLVSTKMDVNMTSHPSFCGSVRGEECVLQITQPFPHCDDSQMDIDSVIVAVKTCEKFHKNRLSILQQTWGGEVRNMMYVSDKEDTNIPTIYAGTPNTESGHCHKLMLILEKLYTRMQQDLHLQWAVVADDDTLLSIPRLLKMLSCFEANEEIFLGERYGYGVSAGYGYDYITLGGGMVVSRAGLDKFMTSGGCKCASKDAPDDMTLGMCLNSLEMTLAHSSHFHQARPDDYSVDHITDLTPLSFHRHWAQDTVAMYRKWLLDESAGSQTGRTEL